MMKPSAFSTTICTFACLATATPALAAKETTLEPNGDWSATNDGERCILQRTYRDGRKDTRIDLIQYQPGDKIDVRILDDKISKSSSFGRISFNDDAPVPLGRPTRSLVYEGGLKALIFYDVPYLVGKDSLGLWLETGWPADARTARENKLETLAVHQRFGQITNFPLYDFHSTMNQMRACMADLLQSWGLDPEVQGNLSRRAKFVELEQWAPRLSDDFPLEMAEYWRSALVQVRLLVNAEGKVTHCSVQNNLKHEAFEEAACSSLMKYARVAPALDAVGKPVESYLVSNVYYSS